jgi:hypothetical protein
VAYAPRDRTPKIGAAPAEENQIRLGGDPSAFDGETIVWAFGVVDVEGPWGWRTGAARAWWREILPKLQNLETMTWADILRPAGGRTHGNNNHPVAVEKLTKQAKDRLREINQDDVAELFSLRLDGTKRIYGIRDRRVLKLLWYDPFHGNNGRAVCPVRKR